MLACGPFGDGADLLVPLSVSLPPPRECTPAPSNGVRSRSIQGALNQEKKMIGNNGSAFVVTVVGPSERTAPAGPPPASDPRQERVALAPRKRNPPSRAPARLFYRTSPPSTRSDQITERNSRRKNFPPTKNPLSQTLATFGSRWRTRASSST